MVLGSLVIGCEESGYRWIDAWGSGHHGRAAAAVEPIESPDQRAGRGDGFVLTGTKTWISNAPEADVYTVFARNNFV